MLGLLLLLLQLLPPRSVASRGCSTVTLLAADRAWLDMACVVARQSLRQPHQCVLLHALDGSAATCDEWRRLMWRAGVQPPPCVPVDAARTSGGDWGTPAYFARIAPRLSALLVLLESRELGAGVRGVLVLDADVALVRNVAARAERAGADFVFQRELPCAETDCVNGGVFWADARAPAVRRVLRRAVRYMHELALPDQDALQAALAADESARVRYFDAHTHPNGWVAAYDNRVARERNLHLLHANWLRTRADKRARLAQLAVWRRDAALCGALPNATERQQHAPLPALATCDLPRAWLAALGCRSQPCAARRSALVALRCPPQERIAQRIRSYIKSLQEAP